MSEIEDNISEEELANNAPLLFGIDKASLNKGKGGLSAPDEYFDTLSSRIQDKIQAELPVGIKNSLISRIFKRKIIWAIPIMAGIVTVIFILNQPNNGVEVAEVPDSFESIQFDDLDEMLVDELVEEFVAFSFEDEDLNLLEEENETNLLASLDSDTEFENFFDTEFDEFWDEASAQPEESFNEADLQMIEDYFSDESTDFDFDVLTEQNVNYESN
jgi:hypothetical protein